MMRRLAQLLRTQFFRYLLTGGSAYVLEIVIIIVAQNLGASSVVAVAISFWVGLVYSFVLQKFFSFGDKRTHHKVVMVQVLLVMALVAFHFPFTVAVTYLLDSILPTAVIRTLAIGCTTLWNFYLYKRHIFKTPVID